MPPLLARLLGGMMEPACAPARRGWMPWRVGHVWRARLCCTRGLPYDMAWLHAHVCVRALVVVGLWVGWRRMFMWVLRPDGCGVAQHGDGKLMDGGNVYDMTYLHGTQVACCACEPMRAGGRAGRRAGGQAGRYVGV